MIVPSITLLLLLLLHMCALHGSDAGKAPGRLYSLLGVDKNADENSLKKAYRKMVMKVLIELMYIILNYIIVASSLMHICCMCSTIPIKIQGRGKNQKQSSRKLTKLTKPYLISRSVQSMMHMVRKD